MQVRILLWAPLGAGTHYWGPGTNIYRLYSVLKDKRYHITLVHGSSQQGKFPDVFDEQVALAPYDGGPIDKMRFFYEGRQWLKKNYKKFDIFHGISAFETTFHFALMFERYGKPAFIKITGEYGGFGDSGRLSRLLGISRRREKNANGISGYIAISTKIVANLKFIGIDGNKIFNIPNGVDTHRFNPVKNVEDRARLRENLGLKDRLTISYVGGLTENKRIKEIVSAVQKMINENIDIQLLLVGPDRSGGVEYNKIKDSLNERIIHIPFTDAPEQYLKASNIYVLNSKSEGMPNSLLEAMSTGLICLATPASGSADLITDSITGFVLDGTSNDIIEKVRYILLNYNFGLEIGKNARNKILEEYSAISVMNRHLELFEKYVR